jgi:cell division protein FtsL
MAKTGYQYGTSPRKIEPEVRRNPKTQKAKQKKKIHIVEDKPRQEVKLSKEQRKRQKKLTLAAIGIFAILLAISYQNSQINVKFNEMQTQKKQLASLQKENEQLKVNIENSLNLNNIEKEAKEQLGMQKLTNKQTVYVSLPKKDYVESASEKVILEEKKNWFEQLWEKMMK